MSFEKDYSCTYVSKQSIILGHLVWEPPEAEYTSNILIFSRYLFFLCLFFNNVEDLVKHSSIYCKPILLVIKMYVFLIPNKFSEPHIFFNNPL